MREIREMVVINKTNYKIVTYCRGQSFWRMTGRRTPQTPDQGRSGGTRRLCLGPRTQSPGTRSRRTGSVAYAERIQDHDLIQFKMMLQNMLFILLDPSGT